LTLSNYPIFKDYGEELIMSYVMVKNGDLKGIYCHRSSARVMLGGSKRSGWLWTGVSAGILCALCLLI
jgi:hypothetical protein